MDLTQLKIVSKRHVFEHPEYPGFRVDLNYLPRKEWEALQKQSEKKVWVKGSPRFEMDKDFFYPELAARIFNGWSGINGHILSKLIPVEWDDEKLKDEEIEFSKKAAGVLMRNSAEFDEWITSVVSELQMFEDGQIKEAEKK